MTKADKIRSFTDDELGHFLCDITIECDRCVVRGICSPGHNGFKKLMKQKYGERDNLIEYDI